LPGGRQRSVHYLLRRPIAARGVQRDSHGTARPGGTVVRVCCGHETVLPFILLGHENAPTPIVTALRAHTMRPFRRVAMIAPTVRRRGQRPRGAPLVRSGLGLTSLRNRHRPQPPSSATT